MISLLLISLAAAFNAICDTLKDHFNTSYGYIDLQTQNTSRLTISWNGAIGTSGVGSTNIYNPSDERLKRDIIPINYGLSEIMQLKPSQFKWIQGFAEAEEDKLMLGFIAQDIQEVIPEVIESFGEKVTIKKDGIDIEIKDPIRVNEKFIIPIIVKAIQELKQEFEDYKSTHP